MSALPEEGRPRPVAARIPIVSFSEREKIPPSKKCSFTPWSALFFFCIFLKVVTNILFTKSSTHFPLFWGTVPFFCYWYYTIFKKDNSRETCTFLFPRKLTATAAATTKYMKTLSYTLQVIWDCRSKEFLLLLLLLAAFSQRELTQTRRRTDRPIRRERLGFSRRADAAAAAAYITPPPPLSTCSVS